MVQTAFFMKNNNFECKSINKNYVSFELQTEFNLHKVVFSNMDFMRIHLLVLLFFCIVISLYQIQLVDSQEYYAFNNIPDDINATFGNVIVAFESDLNEISSLASPSLDPRQVVNPEINDERLEEMGTHNFDGNFQEGIDGLKKLTSSFTASGSEKDGVESSEFTVGSNFIQDKINLANFNLNENFAETLSIMNSIAIIILVIILKIKFSNKILVSKASKK